MILRNQIEKELQELKMLFSKNQFFLAIFRYAKAASTLKPNKTLEMRTGETPAPMLQHQPTAMSFRQYLLQNYGEGALYSPALFSKPK